MENNQSFDKFLSKTWFVITLMDKYQIESTVGSGATSIVKLAKRKDLGTIGGREV